jgi:hypothetical protein
MSRLASSKSSTFSKFMMMHYYPFYYMMCVCVLRRHEYLSTWDMDKVGG